MLKTVCSKRFIIIFSIIFIFVFQQDTLSAGKFGRKSISIISDPLLTPSASDIPPGRSQEILSAIRLQIQMPRFDYNYMPRSQEIEFWKKAETYFSETMRNLESVAINRVDVERQLVGVETDLATIREQIKEQEELIKSLTESGRDATRQRSQLTKYRSDRDKLESQRSSLVKQRDDLISQQRLLEGTLFRQASELMTETIAPKLSSILGDPELQKMRAKQYVSEAERNSFIVLKAKELGITSEDIERVMDSAYVCLVVLTDYDYFYSRDEKTGERILTYNLEGGVVWYKLIVSDDGQKAAIQPLKDIRIRGSASGYPDRPDPFSKVDPDTQIFRNAVNSFVSNLEVETRKIDDFALKTQIVESVGSRVGFPLGKNEGLYVGQKFRVFENVKQGEQIKTEKRGFFYVTKVGDNKTNPNNLSYGKAVIGRLEPGMEVREYATSGVSTNIAFRYGSMGIKTGSVKSIYSLYVKEDSESPVAMLNLSVDYDLGRTTNIPQLFVTVGGDVGFSSFDDVSMDFGKGNPSSLYYDLYGGITKKLYIKNLAFFVSPLFQYQALNISNSDKDGNSVSFNNFALSFSASFGLELALRENFNIGFSVTYNKAKANEWTGTYTPKEGEPEKLFDGFIEGPKVSYPSMLYGGYINISF